MARFGKSKTRMKKPETKARASPGLGRQIHHQFTMQQEARNTERNIWTPGSKLRHKAVNFVRGNDLQPEETKEQTSSKRDEPRSLETKSELDTEKADNDNHDEYAPNGPAFFIDLSSQIVADTGLPDPISKAQSPISECSSGDEIVFHGRNRRAGQREYLHRHPNFEDGFKLPVLKPAVTSGAQNTERAERRDNATPVRDGQESITGGESTATMDDENDVLADYIANMDVDYEETASQTSVELVAEKTIHFGKSRPSDPSPESIDSAGRVDWGYPPNGDESSRERGRDNLEQPGSKSIAEEDATNIPSLEYRGSASPSSNNGLQEIDPDTDFQLEDNSVDDEADFEDIASLQRLFTGQRTNLASNKRAPISASTFADALESDPYYGFDIMDFNRPSLRKKAKGKKTPPDFMISDSELEMELEEAWKNDREKKKSKKQKREELRSRGLLGRSMDKPDLQSKYADGMSFDDLKSEIRTFLLSRKDSLPLPPMSKPLRKVAHDMANALSLKSQSRGKGSSRFPVLYKTSRTPKYNQQNISRADKTLFQGRFRHRTIKTGDQNEKKSAKARSNASYMDGDVVGASAPEIGTENKGRAMLEKMGWSSGTALGATNNKGILLPVAHVVKKSKAGLG